MEQEGAVSGESALGLWYNPLLWSRANLKEIPGLLFTSIYRKLQSIHSS